MLLLLLLIRYSLKFDEIQWQNPRKHHRRVNELYDDDSEGCRYYIFVIRIMSQSIEHGMKMT